MFPFSLVSCSVDQKKKWWLLFAATSAFECYFFCSLSLSGWQWPKGIIFLPSLFLEMRQRKIWHRENTQQCSFSCRSFFSLSLSNPQWRWWHFEEGGKEKRNGIFFWGGKEKSRCLLLMASKKGRQGSKSLGKEDHPIFSSFFSLFL